MQPRSIDITENGRSLVIEWPSGRRDVLDARQLWRDCPSAQGKVRRRNTPQLEADSGLRIVAVTAVGNYAINLVFSDGHDRGIYPWALLQEFAVRRKIQDFIIA
jgi:DUF971 family protein